MRQIPVPVLPLGRRIRSKGAISDRDQRSLGLQTGSCHSKVRDQRLRLSRIGPQRLFTRGNSTRGLRQCDRAGAIRGAVADVGPTNFSGGINDIGDRRGDETGPVAFVFCADGADQFGVGVGQQANRIGVKGNMWTVFLAVARDPFEKFLAFFGRLDADAEDLDFSFEISFPLVDKGRHLGPAPGSPAAPVKENHRRRRFRENGGKIDGHAVNIFEDHCGKLIAGF